MWYEITTPYTMFSFYISEVKKAINLNMVKRESLNVCGSDMDRGSYCYLLEITG